MKTRKKKPSLEDQFKGIPVRKVVFDGISGGQCCILPISKEQTQNEVYKGQEYLGVYPYLVYDQILNRDEWAFWVVDPANSNKYVNLKKWLEGNNPYIHN